MRSFNNWTTPCVNELSEIRKRVINGDFMNYFQSNSKIKEEEKERKKRNKIKSHQEEKESDEENDQKILDYSYSIWRIPRWKLLIFVSSTFTDTYHERNLLLGKILPKLREKARKNEIEVSFIDMR